MKIAIDLGHCLSGYDTSAVGILSESKCNRAIGRHLFAKLRALGHEVIDCTVDSGCSSINDSLRKRVNKANSSGAQVFCSIHLNAGGGHGVETYICGRGGKAEQYANAVQKEMVSLGYRDRKVKVANYYVIAQTSMPGILVEAGFVDSNEDCNLFNAEKLANAICKGLTGKYDNSTGGGNDGNTPNPAPNTDGVYEVSSMPYKTNATVVNDWFYVRNKYGDKVSGRRIDIGDEVCILDVSYGKQLVEVVYPTSKGFVHGYIFNATNCLSYKYQNRYSNGSTPETVYQDANLQQNIGSLNAREKATPIYRKNGFLHVVYNTSKGTNTKSGFVKYDGGFSVF